MFAHTRATTVAVPSTKALPVSVRRNSRSTVRSCQTVRPDNRDPDESAAALSADDASLTVRTVWHKRTALREFLRTETGSAFVLGTATVAALVWANISVSSYDKVLGTRVSVLVGGAGVTASVHEFVNSGLMAFFFLVVGLAARREFDVGELRVRSRLALPAAVGLGGMVVPIGIYLIV